MLLSAAAQLRSCPYGLLYYPVSRCHLLTSICLSVPLLLATPLALSCTDLTADGRAKQVPLLCRPTTPLQSCASSLTCLLLSPSIFTILPAFANAAIPLALLSLLICLVYQQLAHVLFKSCSCRLVPTVFFNSSHFSRQPVAFSGQLAHCLTSRAYHVPLVPPCHCLLCSPCPLSSYDRLR